MLWICAGHSYLPRFSAACTSTQTLRPGSITQTAWDFHHLFGAFCFATLAESLEQEHTCWGFVLFLHRRIFQLVMRSMSGSSFASCMWWSVPVPRHWRLELELGRFLQPEFLRRWPCRSAVNSAPKDPTNHDFWKSPCHFLVFEPECRILVFLWNLGPLVQFAGPHRKSSGMFLLVGTKSCAETA